MKKRIEALLERTMAAVAMVIVLQMPLHAFISTWGGTAIGPLLLWKSWKEVLLALMLPLVVWFCALRPDIARRLWQRKINQLIVLYTLLHVLLSLSSEASSAAVIAGLLINLRFLALFLLVQLIVAARPDLTQRFKDYVPGWLLWVGVLLGVLAVLQVFVLPRDFLMQFGYDRDATIAPFLLLDQNPEALRALATLRGPNTLGAYLLLPVAVALAILYQRRRHALAWVSLGLGLTGILLSGSRSAWLGLAATVAALAMLILTRQQLTRGAKRVVVPMIILGVVIGWAALNVPAVRLVIFHSSPGDPTLLEGSTEKHWQAAVAGIEDVVRHPWGSGPGSAGPATFYNNSGVNIAENYFVQIAQEVGILGLGLFVTISLLVYLNIVRQDRTVLSAALVASLAGITVINIFLHGWADDPLSLTWWALAGLLYGAAKIPRPKREEGAATS